MIFDPTSFDPVSQQLSAATIAAINAAIAHQAALGLALDGVAYVSPGVTHATTIFGGDGKDTFSVYHNKATLRLEGEAGNDEFIVRAFVTLDLSVQGNTEVNGGDGTDTINYAINAPVSIDGGAGFDKVVVLGTPFNDAFVVTSQGIFGANLNVTFVNVESAELDTLEGNDTIYILGTNPDIVTTVIGGLGSDTIQVLGDVTLPIVSNEQGRSGVITQGLSSDDPAFDDVGVNGVAVNVLSAAGESLVKIEPTDAPLLVTEDGTDRVLLHQPGRAEAARRASIRSTSRCRPASPAAPIAELPGRGDGVLVSTDGVTFTNAVVLTFDGATAGRQVQDLGQGDRRFRRRRAARRADQPQHHQRQPGCTTTCRWSTSSSTSSTTTSRASISVTWSRRLRIRSRRIRRTEVLEGASGFTDVYSVALTAAPAPGEDRHRDPADRCASQRRVEGHRLHVPDLHGHQLEYAAVRARQRGRRRLSMASSCRRSGTRSAAPAASTAGVPERRVSEADRDGLRQRDAGRRRAGDRRLDGRRRERRERLVPRAADQPRRSAT